MQRGAENDGDSGPGHLSVSSVGSEAMQRVLQDQEAFIPSRTLSVSSVGSEAMQRCADWESTAGFASFSILGRIGGDATFAPPQPDFLLPTFQYPRSDRRRCNNPDSKERFTTTHFQYPRSDRRRCNSSTAAPKAWTPSPFQYPRSDRRRCNEHRVIRSDTLILTFSILGRIGGDATHHSLDRG